jgi:hypothetical protein
MAEDWSREEVRIAVEAYFDMLVLELSGERYNKTAIRQTVIPRLRGRSNGSLEFKNANISAALLDFQLPVIDGYKPRWNFQRSLLPDVIEEVLLTRPDVLEIVGQSVTSKAKPQKISNLLSIFDAEGPELKERSTYDRVREGADRTPVRIENYLEIEARNRSIGLAGEELALAFERERLIALGKDHLARQIEHVSVEQGDGAGFDIHSYDGNGHDRFIEVKTTRYRKETPFFISSNEVSFAQRHSANYALYRLYRFERDPRLFSLEGNVGQYCELTPTQFRASFECA